MRLLKLLNCLIFILALLPVADGRADHVNLPEIKDKIFAPRVLYLENPRFSILQDHDLRLVLKSAKKLVKEHFQIDLQLPASISKQPIASVFQPLLNSAPENFPELIGDFRNSAVDWGRVKSLLIKQIKKQKSPLSAQIAYAKPYLISPPAKETVESFAEAVIETFRHRLLYWTTALAEDGYPVIGKVKGQPDLPLNEYGYWTLMAREGVEADIILTNQLVASVEYIDIPVHTSLRGGITGGATEYNPKSPYGSSVWVSLYPFLSNNDQIVKLRKGEVYDRTTALRYAGAMLAHEIGHQILHLGHPWSNKSCIMTPLRVLNISDWIKGLDPSLCRLGSSPAMTPGVVKIPIW